MQIEIIYVQRHWMPTPFAIRMQMAQSVPHTLLVLSPVTPDDLIDGRRIEAITPLEATMVPLLRS